MRFFTRRANIWTAAALAAVLSLGFAAPSQAADNDKKKTYSKNEIVQKASDFFEIGSESVGKAVERIFAQYGAPDAYIAGEEGSGAIGVGLRYGSGQLFRASGGGPVKVYWQGPSIGFDVGANASKSFTLVYHLNKLGDIYQRFPGVEGSYYFIAGIGVNYQQNGNIVLAPMRTGVGLRAGVNAGYLSYSKERSWLPF